MLKTFSDTDLFFQLFELEFDILKLEVSVDFIEVRFWFCDMADFSRFENFRNVKTYFETGYF